MSDNRPGSLLARLRRDFHGRLLTSCLGYKPDGVPSNADKHNKKSVEVARTLIEIIGGGTRPIVGAGQTLGQRFELAVRDFLEQSFGALGHLRPGKWKYLVGSSITNFEQYEHLADLSRALQQHPKLRAALGDYLIKPDIVIARIPVSEEELNGSAGVLVADETVGSLSPLRARNFPREPRPLLHATISCKWTIRSDRAQNARAEALNLIRNRKGHTPHVLIVTAEPLPFRIASVALGTGDFDCVYHAALYELEEAIRTLGDTTLSDELELLVTGKRLRDITDLALDLAI